VAEGGAGVDRGQAGGMSRDEVWGAIDAERPSLADLLDSLGEQEREVPSLCAGWRVRDVAAHLTLAQMRPPPAVVAAVRVRGNFNRMVHDSAVRQARRLPVLQYAPRLRAMAGSRRKAPGVSHLEPLIDVLVHGQDIAIPLGRSRPMPVGAAVAVAGTRDLLQHRRERGGPALAGAERGQGRLRDG
jgi:uncharacterized protein (TIGR03083 family)